MNFSGISDKSLTGKLLRTPLRLIPSEAALPILQGRLRGRRWIVGSSNHGCWLGSYEYAKRVLFERWVRRGSVGFDIGANVGFYTLLASVLVGDRGRVMAFEPVPRNLRYLRAHLQMNQLANVTVLEAAVSDAEGECRFDEGAGNSVGHISAEGRLRVKVVTIDSLVSRGELPPPTHMKIDVEGAEVGVLCGATATLAAHRPTLFLASHGKDLHRQCCDLLRAQGYHLEPIAAASLDQTDEILAYVPASAVAL